MNDQSPRRHIRVLCLTGRQIDISTPNDLATIVKVIKADGYLLLPKANGEIGEVVPYHIIASFMEMGDAMPEAIPLATIQTGGRA